MAAIYKGEGLAHADMILGMPDPNTGLPWDSELAVDELLRMVSETEELTARAMSNVPEPVVWAIRLLSMAVGTIGIVLREKIVPPQPKPPGT